MQRNNYKKGNNMTPRDKEKRFDDFAEWHPVLYYARIRLVEHVKISFFAFVNKYYFIKNIVSYI